MSKHNFGMSLLEEISDLEALMGHGFSRRQVEVAHAKIMLNVEHYCSARRMPSSTIVQVGNQTRKRMDTKKKVSKDQDCQAQEAEVVPQDQGNKREERPIQGKTKTQKRRERQKRVKEKWKVQQ